MDQARGTRPRLRTRHWAVAGVALLALSGCAAQAASDAGAPSASTATTESSSDGAGSPAEAGSGTAVQVGSTSLGDVLVDQAGMTLYMFDKDTQGGPSTCYDQCASAWPPLLTDGAPAAGTGADDGKLGTVERTDGATQVTYDGWPLYYWAQDAKPGDVNGQGVNDVWWVLDADGTPIHG
ncbi:MAG: hypothetical protein KQH57_14100 [Actinomycetales bacterium]|nr:hypothetical protein [Actinomycetales bacterium]